MGAPRDREGGDGDGDGGTSVVVWDGGTVPSDPVTFIGMERPEGLHPDSRVITPENLRDLIPE
jgi:hypothetical protein